MLPVGADTQVFRPTAISETQALRHTLGLTDLKVIVFGGVVRPHKGLEILLDAIRLMRREDVRLLIVGPETEHVRDLLTDPVYNKWVRCTGAMPKGAMPSYLSLADAIVLPQVDNPLAQSQVPCKVFEAMAMGKPVLASAVSDLPKILMNCGWTIPPDDSAQMAKALRFIFDNPAEAARRSACAREKCVKEYDVSVTRRKLADLLGQI